jgi:hypothetical protein
MSVVPDPYVPPEGYQVPPTYGHDVQQFTPGAYDPLVPAPESRFEGWWTLVIATFKRSAWTLILIFALTWALPSIVLIVAGGATGAVLAPNPLTIAGERGGVRWNQGAVAGLVLAIVIFLFVTTLLIALGWGAGIHAIVQAAAGHRVSLAAAFRAGLRRLLPMWGWSVLAVLIIAVGVVFCVVPGLYFLLALSLFSFAVMFERNWNHLGRSIGLVNDNFGAAIGRVALLFGGYLVVSIVVSCVVGVLAGLLSAVLGTPNVSTFDANGEAPIDISGSSSLGVSLVADILSTLLQQAVALPLLSFLLVGLMITYTQLRSNRAPLSTPQLLAEVNA